MENNLDDDWVLYRNKTKSIIMIFLIVSIGLLKYPAKALDSKNFLMGQNGRTIQITKEYLPFEYCRTNDLNNPDSPANIYRTAVTNLDPKKPIRVLVYLVDFVDLPGSDYPSEILNNIRSSLDDYFKSVSYNKIKFSWVVSDSYARLPISIYDYNAFERKNMKNAVQIIRDAQDIAFKSFNISDFDYFIATPPPQTGYKEIATSISYLPKDPSYLNSTILAGDFWQMGGHWQLLAHELGHAFGLLDLYKIQSERDNQALDTYSQFSSLGFYDLMNWPTGPAPELLGWSRLFLGFLNKDQIRCLSTKPTITKLAPIESIGKSVKLLLIKISDSKAIAIENRAKLSFDKNLPFWGKGVIVYVINLKIESGDEPVTLITSSPTKKRSFFNQAILTGEKVRVLDYLVENLGSSKGSQIVRTKKYK